MEFPETELDTEKMINSYHNLPKGHHIRQQISSLLLDANSSTESKSISLVFIS